MRDYEIIICGGGVGGLALAIALGRQHRSILVIEKHQPDVRVHRGELLQPRTLEILQEWGVLSTLEKCQALRINALEIRTADGAFAGELNYELLQKSFNHGLVHYYHQIKTALYETARGLAEIHYGTRVVDLLRDGNDSITGVKVQREGCEEEITGELIVAADGRTSSIRQNIGIAVSMFEYPHQLMGFDLVGINHLPPKMSAFLSHDGVRVLYPMPGQRARLYVQIKRGEFGSLKKNGARLWQKNLLEKTPGLEIIEKHLPEDLSQAQLQGAWNFSAPTWSRSGVALLGDAAHCVHPAAGQGMNASIIDAWSLAWRINAATAGGRLNPEATRQALIDYGNRRQEFAYVGYLCHQMARLCTAVSPAPRFFMDRALRASRKNYRLQYLVMCNVSGYSSRRFTVLDRLRQYGLLPEARTEKL